MRSALAGDDAAYQRLLGAVAPVLRANARRALVRAGQPADQAEDIVQDILLAVHLKRHTWDVKAPFAPWLFAIARNKLIDALRRPGRAGRAGPHRRPRRGRRRDVLQSIAVDSQSIKATAAKLSMSEGAVRVALHRGLANLTARLRKE